MTPIEKELGKLVKELEPAPLREGFQDELRSTLQQAIEKKAGEEQQKPAEQKMDPAQAGPDGTGARQKGAFSWPNWLRNGRGLKLVAGFLVLLLCGGLLWQAGLFGPGIQPALAGEITIKALKEDSLGVDPEAGFVLLSQDPISEKELQKKLKVEPAFEYTLDQKAGGKEYRIIPKMKLAANTVYRLAFDPEGKERAQYSWAFQTKGDFRVVRTLPGDQTTYVPLNTGIEILFSHDNFSLEKAQEYVKIVPQVKGRFEKHGKTLVFVPEKLEAECLYVVTVKKGLPLTDRAASLPADYTFSFETESEEDEEAFTFQVSRETTEFKTSEPPAFPVYFFVEEEVPKAAVSVYRYGDYRAFCKALRENDQLPEWASFVWEQKQQDFSKLSKIAEFEQNLVSTNDYQHYLVAPEALPAGYYAAQIEMQDCVRQVWFQVTDLAVYLVQGEEKSLLWINDLQTKKPVQDAQLQIVGSGRKVEGNKEGVIVLEQNLRTEEREYALIKSGSRETVVPLFTAEDNPNIAAAEKLPYDPRDYWKYFYLDRELFKPGDTVRFWGVLSPRRGAEELKEVELILRGLGNDLYWQQHDTSLLSKTVSVKQGVFSGEIELPTLAPDYYYLEVRKGDTLFLSRGFKVATYQKPAYKIKVEREKTAIFAGEKVHFPTEAAFFEGTPVSQVKLNYNIMDETGQVITDEKGQAQIPYSGHVDNFYSEPYRYVPLEVTVATPEAGEISASSVIYVFASKFFLEGAVQRNGQEVTLDAGLFRIDLDKINAGMDIKQENYLGQPVAGQPIKGTIYQEIWTKIETGQSYNFITKQVEKQYSYTYDTKKLTDFTMTTNQEGKALYKLALDPQHSYYVDLTAPDAEGRIARKRVYIHEDSAYGRGEYYKYYRLQKDKEYYNEGEQVSVAFMDSEHKLAEREQAFLFYRGQKEIEAFQVSDRPEYGFVFSKTDIPNTNVGAVYFDGNVYIGSMSEIIPFDREEKALQVELTTDQKEYRPKDKVSLRVKVTDQEKRPVKARVNLNLVDEAIYAMNEQDVNFLVDLYHDYVLMYLDTRASHDHPAYPGGAEQGGGGDELRDDFTDTVLFTTVETDGRGEAQVEFVLPDNLTNWRVTYHAMTQDLQAASGTYQIPVRLPFFVDLVFNEQYLVGDTPVVLVRSYGEKVSPQDTVVYQLELHDPAGKVIKKQGKAKVAESFNWQLPALQEGTYTLVAEGKAGDSQDKLSQSFTVAASFLERFVSSHRLLEENTKLQGSPKEPTYVVFSNYEQGQYLCGLWQLVWDRGERLEQKLAAAEARKLLAEYYAQEDASFKEFVDEPAETDEFLPYQKEDGGIALLPYGESDPVLTALVASLGSPGFDRSALIGYFYALLEKGEKEGKDPTPALWGLGALGEPVLPEINKYLAQEDLAPEQQVYLALAMLDIGNGAVARTIYAELLEVYGEDLGPTMRVKIGQSQDEIIAATGQLAMLAAKLGAPENNKLYQYLLENPGQELLNNLEQLQILKYKLRYLDSEPVSFTYVRKGKTEQKTLQGDEILALYLLPEELAQLQFKDIRGKVGLTTVYSQPYEKEEKPARDDLAVKRTYKVNGVATSTLRPGDLVEVVLEYEIKDLAPAGLYELVDVLPSGLKYVPRPYARMSWEKVSRDWTFPFEVKGPKIAFGVWKGTGKGGAGTQKVVYYARVVSPGEFTAQGTLLSNGRNRDVRILGEEDRIVIK